MERARCLFSMYRLRTTTGSRSTSIAFNLNTARSSASSTIHRVLINAINGQTDLSPCKILIEKKRIVNLLCDMNWNIYHLPIS